MVIKMVKIIDGKDQVMGRLASQIVKLLQQGEKLEVLNANDIIISGNSKKIREKFYRKKEMGDPHHGPYFSKEPYKIFKRSVRGMLPYKKNKGRKALENLKVFNGNPNNKKGETLVKTKRDLLCNHIKLGEIYE